MSTPGQERAVGLVPADGDGIAAAVERLRAGGLVGLPTETVYGLAADALSPSAVARIFAAKGRPPDNPLIVHLADPDQLGRVAGPVEPWVRDLAACFWPGPLTLVLTASAAVPAITRAGLPTVAVRIPAHPVAHRVLTTSGLVLAAPSANRSGRPSPTTATDVLAELGDRVDLILDGGPAGVGVESTVIDVRGPRPVVLRDGSVSREDLGLHGSDPAPAASSLHSPGTRYRHYAPNCRVVAVSVDTIATELAAADGSGERVGLVLRPATLAGLGGRVGAEVVATFDDADDLARGLYRSFLLAEERGVDRLLVESVPPVGIGRAVMDRIRRAAEGWT